MYHKLIKVIVLLACIILLLSGIVTAQAAGTTLSISAPANGSIHSWEDSLQIKWNSVTGAAQYYIALKNDETGEYYIQNKSVTRTYFSIGSYLPEEPALIKVLVSAVKSTSETAEQAFTSDSIYLNIGHEPEVTCGASSSITKNSAKVELTISRNFGRVITDCGFYVGTSSTVSRMTRYSYGAADKGTKTMTITGLEPGTKYYYRAYAENDVGEEYTTAKNFTTQADNLAQSVITNPAADTTLSAGKSIKVQWSSVSGAEGYRCYIKQLQGEPYRIDDEYGQSEPFVNSWSKETSASTRNYTLSAENVWGGYWYKFVVEAFASGKNASWSDWCYVYIDKKVLADPVIISPIDESTIASNQSVELRWSSVNEAEGYECLVKRLDGLPDRTNDNEPGTNILDKTVGASVTSCTVPAIDITPGCWYKFVVKATAAGCDAAWSQWVYCYAERGKLSRPVITSPIDAEIYAGNQAILFDWDAVSGATGYEYFIKRLDDMPDRSNDNEPGTMIEQGETGAGTTQYTLPAAKAIPGKWYKFVVRAFADGYDTEWSEWVYCKLEQSKLDDPVITNPVSWTNAAAGKAITVNWQTVNGAAEYYMYWKRLSGQPNTSNDNEPYVEEGVVACATSLKYVLPADKAIGGYWYKFVVKAQAGAENTSWSNWVYVYIPQDAKLARPVITSPTVGVNYESGNDVYFAWSEVPNATRYTYYIKQLTGEPDGSSIDATNEEADEAWTGTMSAGKRRITLSGDFVQPNTWYKFVVQAEAPGYSDSWSRYTYIKIPERTDWIHYTWPSKLKVITSEFFCDNSKLRTFDASTSMLERIESRAFANCGNVQSINLPYTVSSIAEDAFVNCPNLTIHCIKDSYAEGYALRKGIKVEAHGVGLDVDSLSLSRSSWDIATADEADMALTIDSSSDWNVSVQDAWVTVSKTSGKDGDSVIIKAQKNNGAEARSTVATFTCGNVQASLKIWQNYNVVKGCALKVWPTEWTLVGDINSRWFSLESDGGFTVTSNQPWITCSVVNNSFIATVDSAVLATKQDAELTVTCRDCGMKLQIPVSINGTAVSAPTEFTVTERNNDPHALSLMWKPVKISGATYIVERSSDKKTWTRIRNGITETSFTDADGLSANVTYYYHVYAQVGSAISQKIAGQATTENEKQVAYTGAFGSLSDGRRCTTEEVATLSWSAIEGAYRYEVSVAKLVDGKFSPLPNWNHRNVGNVQSVSLAELLAEGSTYRVWVGAYNMHGRIFGQTNAVSFTVSNKSSSDIISGMPRVSNELLAFLKKQEGCYLYLYDDADSSEPRRRWDNSDQKGNPTIGMGHLVSKTSSEFIYYRTNDITWEEAMALKETDIRKCVEYAERFKADTGFSLNQHQFDALVSYFYNCGYRNDFVSFFKGKSLNDIPAWQIYNIFAYPVTGKDGVWYRGLYTRRMDEATMFVNGTYLSANYGESSWSLPSWWNRTPISRSLIPSNWYPIELGDIDTGSPSNNISVDAYIGEKKYSESNTYGVLTIGDTLYLNVKFENAKRLYVDICNSEGVSILVVYNGTVNGTNQEVYPDITDVFSTGTYTVRITVSDSSIENDVNAHKAYTSFKLSVKICSTAEFDPALPIPALSGSLQNRLLQVARSQIGYREKDNNLTVYGEYTVTNGYAWCAPFVSWCASQAGLSDTFKTKGTYANPDNLLKNYYSVWYFETYKSWSSKGVPPGKGFDYFFTNAGDKMYDIKREVVVPQTGDLIFFATENGPWAHVGIVESYDDTTKRITYIDGNGKDDAVSRWSLYLNCSKICAIARPNYK